jgi:hypothetical protein
MFANMGSSGGSGGGGGGKPTGGQGGLWKKGPDGKRIPQAGMEGAPKGDKHTPTDSDRVLGDRSAALSKQESDLTSEIRRLERQQEALRPSFGQTLKPKYRKEREAEHNRLQQEIDKRRSERSDVQRQSQEIYSSDTGRASIDRVTRAAILERQRKGESLPGDDVTLRMINQGLGNTPALTSPRVRNTRADQQRRKLDLEAQRHRATIAASPEGSPARQRAEARLYAIGDKIRAMDDQVFKSLEIDMNITPIIDDLETLYAEIADLAAEDDTAIKAGRRNNGVDQASIDQGYALAEQLCELFETLGATVEEDEEEIEGGEVEMMEGKAETVYGSEIKALDGDAIGGFAVLFGDESTPDLSEKRDFFTKSTDYWLDRFGWPRPMTYHHGIDEDTRDDPIVGVWNKAVVKDEGIWLEGQLDRAHRYHGAIKELVRRGYLKLSSDSAPQWVIRERRGSAHEVKRWPLLTASPTVTPAEPRLSGLAFKALVAELGLSDIQDNSEASQDAGERSDETKAQDDRVRQLLLRSKLLALQE